jgi:hypothetical protein
MVKNGLAFIIFTDCYICICNPKSGFRICDIIYWSVNGRQTDHNVFSFFLSTIPLFDPSTFQVLEVSETHISEV